jgi:taurine dioxygenase
VRLRRLHPAFGAEILDLDANGAWSPAQIEELRQAFREHQLLLFRGQGRVAPQRHVEICSWPGPLATEREDGELWTLLDNKDAAGASRLEFHCDHSYTDTPIDGISLHAVELPHSETATAFVSGVDAWRRLSAADQAQLAQLTLRHRLSTAAYGDDWPDFIADHPMCTARPRTGEPVLYVTEHHAHRVVELEREASDRLLERLFAHIYAPEHIYMHEWRINDLLIWDNSAIQHARPAAAHLSEGRRVLQRVAMAELSLDSIMTRARERRSPVDKLEGRR